MTPVGTIVPWDGSAAVEWHVAADDRWHDTRTDTGIRHRRVDGVAVFETKVRVPGGDAVQHVWSVADHGGLTVVDVANESPLPIAVAFTRPDLLTGRPPTDVPIQGIDLPPGSIVVPVGHRASVTVALAHRGPSGGQLPDRTASAAAVARGWIARVDAASRLELGDPSAVDAVRAARCELVLCGPADAGDDPVQFLIGAAELVRMAEWDERDAVAVVPDVAAAVERAAVDPSPLAGAALAPPVWCWRSPASVERSPTWGASSAGETGAPARCRRGRASSRSQRWRDASPPADVSSPRASRRRGAASTSRPTGWSSARPRACHSHCAGTASTWRRCGR